MGNSRSIVGACCAAVLCQAAWAVGPVDRSAIDPDAGLPVVTGLEAGTLESVSPPQLIELAGSGECEEIGGLDRQFLATNRLRGNWYDFEALGLLTQIQVFLDLPDPTDLHFFVYKERAADPNVFDLMWTDVLPAGESGPQFYESPEFNGGELRMEMGASYVIGVGWGATSVIFGRSDDGPLSFSRGEVRGVVGIDRAPPPPDPEEGWEFNDPFNRGMYFAQLCFAPDPGACCYLDEFEELVCDDTLNATECLNEGGEFAGPSTSCQDVSCPLPRAACCVDGECLDELTQFQCESIEGGDFVDGTRCVDEPCAPRGACCVNGECIPDYPVTEDECVEEFQGSYRGDGSECDDFPGCNAGACCLDDFCVRGMSQDACRGAGGAFKGAGSDCEANTCDPEGACCLDDGSCQDSISPAACADLGGAYRGDNSACAKLDPSCGLGACCRDIGCSDNKTKSQCEDFPANGVWRGDGSTCDTIDPHCEGSCCENREVCRESGWSPELCDAFDGVFRGYGVSCEDDPPCPVEQEGSFCCLSSSYSCVEVASDAVCLAIGGTPGCGECFECDENSDCDNGVFCDGTETCVGAECQSGADPCPGQACREDIDQCVDCLTDTDCPGGQFCDSGNNVCVECVVDGHCNDRNPCTTDTCEANACVSDPVPDGTDCADEEFCNGSETCQTGECIGVDPCVDREHCDEGAEVCLDCVRDEECSDDVFCNGAELCENNVCNMDVPDPCEDLAHCDEENDVCLDCVSDEECADEFFCNGAEVCENNVCNLDVPDPCIDRDHCNEETDRCLECFFDSECPDDGIWCNGVERCIENACVTEITCEEGMMCDEEGQRCEECFVHEDCEGDPGPCRKWVCHPDFFCLSDPDEEQDDDSCDDGEYCNGVETCLAGVCDGPDPCVDPEHCDEEAEVCLECIADEDCADQFFCNGAELCEDNVCNLDVPDACIDDDHCDEENDECLECIADGECDDGLFCTGAETCVDNGCVAGQDPCVEGERCDEDNDVCVQPCVRDPVWICDGDVDGDGQVNPVDSGLVQASFGSTDEQDLCSYDIDCDGQINPVDSGIVQSLFGRCDAPRSECP